MPERRTVRPQARHTRTPLTDPAMISRIRAVLALGGVPWDQLDDGVQQVRVKHLEATPHGQVRNEEAWLMVVAARVAADWHRTQKRDTALRQRLANRWSRWPPKHPQEDRMLALAVADALETLPPGQRQVLTLRFYADLTVRDIAGLLDIPEGTVKSRLHTAMGAMRAQLSTQEVI